MARDTRSDLDLIADVGRTDAAAFGVVFERYHGVVLAYLRRRTRQPEVAADLCGEVFARALLALHEDRVTIRESVPAWLLTIARNALLDSVRRGRVEARARRRLGIPRLSLTDDDMERIEMQTDDLGRVLELVDDLPEDQKVALRARILEERDYSEIAADLGCSDLVVRQRVSRALRRLRSRLEASP